MQSLWSAPLLCLLAAMAGIDNCVPCWFQRAVHRGRSVAALLPIMAVVFIAFLIIGIAMPVLPLHVHDGLGLGTFAVGLVGRLPFWLAAAVFVSATIFVLQFPQRREANQVLQGAAVAVLTGLSAGVGVTLVFQKIFLVQLP